MPKFFKNRLHVPFSIPLICKDKDQKQKALEFNLEIQDSELYKDTFAKFLDKVPKEEEKQTSFDKIILKVRCIYR